MVATSPWSGTAVAAVTPQAPGDPGLLRLRLADFPSLAGAFGSVRLGFVNLNVGGPLQPFIVSKDGDAVFVVSAICTHAGCVIPAFSSTKTSTCPCQQSRFSASGSVLRGPATERLAEYEASLDEAGVLTVVIPEFAGFDVVVSRVVSTAVNRVAVAFTGVRGVDYEIRSRTHWTDPGTVRSFALTESGSANQTSFRSPGGEVTLFVEREGSSGFLSVAAKARQV